MPSTLVSCSFPGMGVPLVHVADVWCIFKGLFTPNAGQHFRDEQRRRRSQYDRGTRLAALEEYDYGMYSHQDPMY